MSYTAWALLLSSLFFLALKKNDRLRVHYLYEIIGLDFMKHMSDGDIQLENLVEELRKENIKKYYKEYYV